MERCHEAGILVIHLECDMDCYRHDVFIIFVSAVVR